MKKIIRSAHPSITNQELKYIAEAAKNGWGSKMNKYLDEFSNTFRKHSGKKYILATSHCTSAIHLALIALGVKKGDEVIVPDLTWVASAAPITYLGAIPVFADIDPKTLCISAETIKKKITKKTKLIIVVGLLGNLPEWDDIKELCKRKNIRILEDAAESLGAKYKGKKAGSFGDVSVFSFNATKLVNSGQGGCFCTNDYKLYKVAKLHSHHGMNKENPKKFFWSTVVGFQYNWTNIQAAMALSQLKRVNDLLKTKKTIYNNYKNLLPKNKNLSLNQKIKNVTQTYWITYLTYSKNYKIKKEDFIKKFKKYNIDIRPMFYPVSSMPPFKKFTKKKNISLQNKNSYNISKHSICLPSGNDITYKDQKFVISILKKILKI